MVDDWVRVRTPNYGAMGQNAALAEREYGGLLRLVEDVAPRITHTARLLAPEFSGGDLARIRVSLGLSIEEVACLASVTVWQIRHMEEGSSNPRYRPSAEVFESVRAALHCHIMRRLNSREGIAPERRRQK